MRRARAADPRRVLIVDDESAIRAVLAAVVEDVGFRSMVAHDGRQALNMARSRAPALVITDLKMPHMDGAALIAALRTDWGTRLPVIMVSGAPMAQMLAAGADAVLPKPFAVCDLLALLGRLVPDGSANRPAA